MKTTTQSKVSTSEWIIGSLLAVGCVCYITHVVQTVPIRQCSHQMSAIGDALILYAEDHDGYVPPYALTTARAANGNYYTSEPIKWRQALVPYISSSSEIFTCPLRKSEELSYTYHPFLGPDVFGTQEGHFWLNINHPPQKWFEKAGRPLEDIPLMYEVVKEDEQGRLFSSHGDQGHVLFFTGQVKFQPMN